MTSKYTAILIASMAPVASAQMVTNGSMTGPVMTGSPPPGWGSFSIDGDTIGPGGFNGWATGIAASNDGGTFAAVLNNGPGAGFDEIAQIVSGFNIGQTYTLEFEWANAGLDSSRAQNYANSGFVRATIGNTIIETTDFNHQGFGNQTWFTTSAEFVADSESLILSFRGVSTESGGYAAGVDGVRIIPAPTTAAVLALTGLVGARRRR